MSFVSYVSQAFASVLCFLVVNCRERTDLFALVSDVYCIFVTFPCGILGQVWYLIVSFTDLCLLFYFIYKLDRSFGIPLGFRGCFFQQLKLDILDT